ncbi:M56 family metallopeptidase [Hymenobacter sp. H14-R3]|uniref:M56 family metallopeptidase n=1 Tax=Hymenobacter sp. H14-R3 TaxID=3046308 RepID=UPI0024BB43B5|nr:M56 family metallopeptidase [Hymenobacter sp. H14-R3]MDJ0364475.1 M56 family metallopeptidase [Hymenobacter sp. H14-R3]
MAALFDYLLRANAVLLLFAAAYYGLLRRLTFFQLNRAYLLLALLFAAVYPALPVPALLPASARLLPAATLATGAGPAAVVAQMHSVDYKLLIISIYAAGTGLLLLRLLAQLMSLAWVRARARPAVVLGQAVRVRAGAGGPFSFGRTIYLSAATLADAANLAPALRHEQAHVRQLHTLDVLLTQLATALAWANPAAWLLRRAVLDNLEYLADHAALQTGLDRRAYQYSLLRQQPGGVPAPALAFHFSFLTLKNRITMLNQPASTTRQLGRYLLAAPLLVALALGYSSAHAQVAPTPVPAPKPSLSKATYYVDGKVTTADALNNISPDNIASVSVVKDAKRLQVLGLGQVSAEGAVLITTKAKANAPDVLAFNKQFSVQPATAAQQAALAAAQAYITKTYPNAKIESVFMVKNQPGRYQAIFMEAGQRQQQLFDAQGQPVAK